MKKPLLHLAIFLFFFLGTSSSFAQSGEIDSLKSVLQTQNNEEKCETMLKIASKYHLAEVEKFEYYSNKALQLAQKNSYDQFISEAYYNLGRISISAGDLAKADSLLQLAKNNLSREPNEKVSLQIYNQLATVSLNRGLFEKCREYADLGKKKAIQFGDDASLGSFFLIEASLAQMNLQIEIVEEKMLKARECFIRSDFYQGLVAVEVNLASIAQMKGDFENSISMYEDAFSSAEKASDHRIQAIIQINKGHAELRLYQTRDAMKSAKIGFELAQEYDLGESMIDALLLQGDVYVQELNFEEGLDVLSDGIQLSKEKDFLPRTVQFYNKRGGLYFRMGKLDRSFDDYFRALELSEELNYQIGIEDSYARISEVYKLSGDFNKANQYLQESLQIAKSFGVPFREGIVYKQIAELLVAQKKWSEALEKYDQAIKKVQDAQRMDAITEIQIGKAYAELKGNNIMAARVLLEDVNPNTLQNGELAYFNWNVGELNLELNDLNKAEKAFLESVRLSKLESNNALLLEAYSSLVKLEQKRRNYKSALYYQMEESKLRSTIFDAIKVRQIALIEIDYETKKKENEIKLLSQDREIQALKLEDRDRKLTNSRKLLTIVVLISALVIVFGLLIFNRYRIRKREQEVMTKKKELDLKEKNLYAKTELEKAVLSVNYYKDLSHEIRTPLTLIIGPLEQLNKVIPEQEKKRFDTILKNANRLMKLVNESLKVRLLDSNGHSPVFKTCLVSKIIEKNIELFSSKSIDQNISIEFIDKTDGAYFVLDEEKIDLVLINLLSNALDHSNAKDRIVVRAEVVDSNLVIRISDSGDGIPEEHLPHVFDRYYSVDSSKENSSGIGLALTKELVEMHEGTIEVQNCKEGGAQFTICLPTNLNISRPTIQLEDIKTTPFEVSSIPESAASVLIVEDNAEVVNLLIDILSSSYRILLANNGEKGITLAMEEHPDLIVSDIMMPKVDGMELVKTLKDNFSTSHIPIILLTAKTTDHDKIAGLQTGVDDYLTKPFSPKELLVRVENLLKQREQLRKRYSKNIFLLPEEITSTSLDQEFLENATKIIENNLQNPDFNVGKFCRELALNRNSVHQKLKSLTGKSASQFIKSVKLKKAAVLLADERISIIEVSEFSGFNNRQAFYKAFKEQFEMTPTSYRMKCLENYDT